MTDFADNAAWSAYMAEHVVLPRLLELAGIRGQLKAIERQHQSEARLQALDVLGGVDFWTESRLGIITIASRVQRQHGDIHRSFTIRVDIGGRPTEAHKRVTALRDGGLLPNWTAQGYVTESGALSHASIIRTTDLIEAYLEASVHPKHKLWTNPDDGHVFWAGFWKDLKRYGHAESLKVIEPPESPRKEIRDTIARSLRGLPDQPTLWDASA